MNKQPIDGVKAFFTKKELWAMWQAVCWFTKNPMTSSLKYKLYDLLTEEEHREMRKKYGEPLPLGVKPRE